MPGKEQAPSASPAKNGALGASGGGLGSHPAGRVRAWHSPDETGEAEPTPRSYSGGGEEIKNYLMASAASPSSKMLDPKVALPPKRAKDLRYL